ncbi:hypothetical protein Acr_00g0033890 [Actinidia rufa]|uniref:Transmembrane protein n=1 Tax=Actinidia rufa TaxID=165716 RepID=A0A7J0DFS9_9ERIC|nr:hypothetical protein Acr_00g0033890 [Actinidia rufa]
MVKWCCWNRFTTRGAIRFDRRRCDSRGSSGIQVSPDISLRGWVSACASGEPRSLSLWVGGFLHVRAWYVVAFLDDDGFWWWYGRLGFGSVVDVGVGRQRFGCWVLVLCGCLDFGFLVVGVVWAVVMAAVVAVQFGFGLG